MESSLSLVMSEGESKSDVDEAVVEFSSLLFIIESSTSFTNSLFIPSSLAFHFRNSADL